MRNMWRLGSLGSAVALVLAVGAGCDAIRTPDLTVLEAAKLISMAPEFNRYARLIGVERVDHLRGSMDSVSYGVFTFVHLNSPSNEAGIKAWADFRYLDHEWRLNQFDYGCDHSAYDHQLRLADCHIINCYMPYRNSRP